MKLQTLLLAVVALVNSQANGVDNDTYLSSYLADMWLEGADMLRILWRDCSKKIVDVKVVMDVREYFPKFVRCMKRKTLRALDRSLSTDVVPITDDVHLVRYELVDRSGNVVPSQRNETSTSWTDKEIDERDWRELAMRRMADVLKTHVIKLDFNGDTIVPEKGEKNNTSCINNINI
ncbi:hypothetical protein EVAR_54621_1 [Eumeta japonica]|uniref:Uncharacterized protein n=1 Tax=Eumeta variegata TaxID=151549 RepID=A0A4C1YIN5_EUMVA|nr:hypothetical protein EVAR_54621_1 [Eumeta japonica]